LRRRWLHRHSQHVATAKTTSRELTEKARPPTRKANKTSKARKANKTSKSLRPLDAPESKSARAPSRANDVHEAALTLFAERGYHGTSMKDIAAALRLQAQSLYNHVAAKQDLLTEVMIATMASLLRNADAAVATTREPVERLRRMTEAHVRFHARHPREVRVGNYEIPSLEKRHRTQVVAARRKYSRMFVAAIQEGVDQGVFDTPTPVLAAYSILQMGIGVSLWFSPDGPISEDELAFRYGDIALRIVGVRREEGVER